jgi:hypothetical protein
MEYCTRVDEETIELQAAGRIEGGFIRGHLDYCNSCIARVTQHRAWIENLKKALSIYDLEHDDPWLTTELEIDHAYFRENKFRAKTVYLANSRLN